MPTYTYQCDNCGVRFDRHQKFSEKPLTVCPECSKKTLRKVYTPVGIVFKGSGFYATDHRSPSGGTHKDGSSKEESKSKKTTEDKPKKEEKKEAKTESKTGSAKGEK
jgi:putative FmdB family regulatory protein